MEKDPKETKALFNCPACKAKNRVREENEHFLERDLWMCYDFSVKIVPTKNRSWICQYCGTKFTNVAAFNMKWIDKL
jgi:hypothetical protein